MSAIRTAFTHRITPLAFAGAASLAAFSAAAEPAPTPETDFTAQWEITGTPVDSSKPTRMTYSSELKKMRIDMNMGPQSMTIVRDMTSGEAVMWSDMMPGMGMKVNAGEGFKLEGERTGRTDEVNGESCEIWTSHKMEICITDDGIPVKSEGRGVTATLKSLDRSPQDPEQFALPEGVEVMDMPSAMSGMMPKPQLPF
ncbi:hypothetical protein ACKTEK_03020 [Tepidamorphus sp. 3E244]|uniref:hypothetical protein n=1 Tax=Tepidamorphus sp. 3E244 TaxID=3385498 RepID=UPI0038FCDA59